MMRNKNPGGARVLLTPRRHARRRRVLLRLLLLLLPPPPPPPSPLLLLLLLFHFLSTARGSYSCLCYHSIARAIKIFWGKRVTREGAIEQGWVSKVDHKTRVADCFNA